MEVESKSVDELDKFLDKYIPERITNASREVKEIMIHKMICERTDMPNQLKCKARRWLLDRGYFPGVNK